jgi:glycosyltransferase involved in cell wall biosynthesis
MMEAQSSNPSSFSLSVIIFALNEEENLRGVIEETLADLKSCQPYPISEYQLVLVDDGSTDGTLSVMEDFSKNYPEITVMSHAMNQGIGIAVKTGFSACRMDYITILPADGQVTLSEIKKLIPSVLDGADMALGYYTQRGDIDGLYRLILSKGLRHWMNFMLGTQRPMDGVYLFRRSMLRSLPLKSETFFVNLELPIRAIREKYDVRSIPVEVKPRRSGSSKVLGWKRILKVGGDVLKFRFHLLEEKITKN